MDSIGSNDGMLCEVCDQKYHTIYSVDDELWVKVTGATEPEDAPGYYSGLWCPHCFSREARAKGITVRWSCAEEWAENLLLAEKRAHEETRRERDASWAESAQRGERIDELAADWANAVTLLAEAQRSERNAIKRMDEMGAMVSGTQVMIGEADRLRVACRLLLKAVYVGDGQVVCPNAIIGPVREIVKAMEA